MTDQCLAPGGFEGGLCRRPDGHEGKHAHRTGWGEVWWPREQEPPISETEEARRG